MANLLCIEAYLRFVAALRADTTQWHYGPPSGVLYCDEEAEAESWNGQQVERSVVVTGQGRATRGDST